VACRRGLIAPARGATVSAEPFKFGTFEIEGEKRLGIVLQDKLIDAAVTALERSPAYPKPGSGEMLEPVPQDRLRT
jgi:hypothetical protein